MSVSLLSSCCFEIESSPGRKEEKTRHIVFDQGIIVILSRSFKAEKNEQAHIILPKLVS